MKRADEWNYNENKEGFEGADRCVLTQLLSVVFHQVDDKQWQAK